MDVIEKIGGSVIQHGKHNNRIYLMKLDPGDSPGIIGVLDSLAVENGYSKIFGKIPAAEIKPFSDGGYTVEARIPGGYRNGEMLFSVKYFDDERKKIPDGELRELKTMTGKAPSSQEAVLDGRFQFLKPVAEDAPIMAALYRKVFTSYPFPIHEPEYLRQTMHNDTVYFGIREQETLVALSSAEMDLDAGSVEMTDFAVLPEYRGNGLALYLLKQMEAEMRSRALKTAYTIARLKSPGMNYTFAKAGYKYTGTLINNTNICGSLESMNVWYKKL